MFKDTCTGEEAVLYSITGNQGTEWLLTQVDIPPSFSENQVQVRLTGVVGTSYKSDIAIDDITLSTGICEAFGGI